MLARSPAELARPSGRELDMQILRVAIMAELDAVSLYEQMASLASDGRVRAVLLEVAREEKTHVGEFLALLRELDPELARELEAGEREVRELIGSEREQKR